jgi:hypothetical protein
MRLAFALALLAGMIPPFGAKAAADVWRPPRVRPSQCSEFPFDVLLVDVSGSMNELDHFVHAQTSATRYIMSEAPDCTSAIVAPFGVTADLARAGFLTDRESRLRLAEAVRKLVANHRYTNLDEAAKPCTVSNMNAAGV